MESVGIGGYMSDGETVGESINLLHLENPNWSQLQDGTIEITDRLPKKEYYMSLRRIHGQNNNAINRLGSMSSVSGMGLANGGTNAHVTTPSSHSGGILNNRSSPLMYEFKPSGKTVDCTVVMLDGTTREFRLDVSIY